MDKFVKYRLFVEFQYIIVMINSFSLWAKFVKYNCIRSISYEFSTILIEYTIRLTTNNSQNLSIHLRNQSTNYCVCIAWVTGQIMLKPHANLTFLSLQCGIKRVTISFIVYSTLLAYSNPLKNKVCLRYGYLSFFSI